MSVSATTLDRIRRAEGLRLTPYLDTVGKLTIGYGHNLADRGITKAQAEMLLADDIAEHEAQLYAALPWTKGLGQVRREVLIEMAFNMGLGDQRRGLLSFAATLSKIRHGDFAGAAAGMLASKWARQVGARAAALAEIMRTGREAA